jgi:hypothetical protein
MPETSPTIPPFAAFESMRLPGRPPFAAYPCPFPSTAVAELVTPRSTIGAASATILVVCSVVLDVPSAKSTVRRVLSMRMRRSIDS